MTDSEKEEIWVSAALDRYLTAHNRCAPFTLEMARYHLNTGGKRLRALIPGQIYVALGRDPQEILPLGIAIELIHNGTLVHDDLQDGDETRRGQPTVWKKFGAAHAINCGDTLLYLGADALLDLKLSADKILLLQRRVLRAVLRVMEGQSQEFLLKEKSDLNWSDYEAVIRGKTAALLGVPVAGALYCADQESGVVDCFEAAAVSLGVLFQIQDDVLDVYGDKGRGYRASDLYEGKLSALVVEFLISGAPSAQKRRLREILAQPRGSTTAEMIAEALELFREQQVLSRALSRINAIKSGIECNSELNRLPAIKTYLLALADKFLEPLRLIELAPLK